MLDLLNRLALMPNETPVGAVSVADALHAAPSVHTCPLEAMQDAWEREELEQLNRNRANASARRARAVKPWQTPRR